MFQLGGPIERTRYYALWTLTEVLNFFFPSEIYLFFDNSSLRVLASSLVLALQVSIPKANHNGTALPTLKSCNSSLRPISKPSWMLGMQKHIYGFVNVYKCVTPRGKKLGFTSSMITFVTSAFWVCVFHFFFGYCLL